MEGEGSLAGDALQCSGGGWLSWDSDKITFLSLECDRDLLSLRVQRLAFPFSLPSAAHGTPLGTSSLLHASLSSGISLGEELGALGCSLCSCSVPSAVGYNR